MRIFRVTVVVEAADDDDVESVTRAISKAICPHPDDAEHRCPRGWMTMTTELEGEEAESWRGSDVLNR